MLDTNKTALDEVQQLINLMTGKPSNVKAFFTEDRMPLQCSVCESTSIVRDATGKIRRHTRHIEGSRTAICPGSGL